MRIEMNKSPEPIRTLTAAELKIGHMYVVVGGEQYWKGHVVVKGLDEVIFLHNPSRGGSWLRASTSPSYVTYRELFDGEEVVISK